MYTNCDTLTNKLSELTIAIELNNPDIIVLTEVTPKNNRYTLQKLEIEIKGFNLFTTNFNEKDSRGVAIYVKKSIISNQIEIENMANDTVWVEIAIEKNKKMLIGGIYRSPNNSALKNKLLFDTIVTASNINKDNFLLIGDFNCSEIDWDDLTTQDQNMELLSNKIIEIIRDCFLQQVIMENTRGRGANIPSLSDLVLCYENTLIKDIEYQSPLGKSDHCVITFSYDIQCISSAYKVKRFFYDKGDYNSVMVQKSTAYTWLDCCCFNAAQIVLTPPAPRNGGPFLPFFGQAGQVDPLVGWRSCY